MAKKALRYFICPYCKRPARGGLIVLMSNGVWAHAACKCKDEQDRRDKKERERLGRKLMQVMDEAKGVNDEQHDSQPGPTDS